MGTGRWIGDLAPEPEPPKEGRWIAKPRKARWTLPVVSGVVLISQLPSWVIRLATGARHSPAMWILTMVVLAIVAVALIWSGINVLLGRRLRIKDQATLDEGFGEQFLVDVTVVSSNSRLGADRGVLWFADGLMGFSGESMSFVLAAADLAPRWDPARRPKNWAQLPTEAITLVNAPRNAYIVVTPLRGKWRAYRDRLAAFLRADELPEGERLWPPLHPYAEEKPALEPVVRR